MLRYISNFDSDTYIRYRHIQREVEMMFDAAPDLSSIHSVVRGSFPAISVGQSKSHIYVYVYVPGLDEGSVQVVIQETFLQISGSRHTPQIEGKDRYKSERYSGEFSRTIGLPDDADSDTVDASYVRGILHVLIKRKLQVEPHKVILER